MSSAPDESTLSLMFCSASGLSTWLGLGVRLGLGVGLGLVLGLRLGSGWGLGSGLGLGLGLEIRSGVELLAHVEAAHVAQGDAKLEAVTRVRATERVEGGPPCGPRCQDQLAGRAW